MRALHVDCDILSSPASGVAVYLREVMSRLARLRLGGEIVNRPAHAASPAASASRAWLRRVPGAYALRAWRQAWPPVPRDAIFWAPNFLLPPFAPTRSVVAVHDTIFWDMPAWADPVRGAFLRAHVPSTLRRAARVIVPTEAVAARVRAIEARAQVVVIADGARLIAAPPVERRSILYFGNIEPRKDVTTLVRAYARLPAAVRAEHPLVIAGQVADAAYARALGVTLTARPSESALASLVAQAAVVVAPSLAEGFGLGPLEALVAGAPVVASDIAVAREVLGDAADYFSPGDDVGLAAMLALRVREPRVPSRDVGEALLARFNWDACARAHAALFESL